MLVTDREGLRFFLWKASSGPVPYNLSGCYVVTPSGQSYVANLYASTYSPGGRTWHSFKFSSIAFLLASPHIEEVHDRATWRERAQGLVMEDPKQHVVIDDDTIGMLSYWEHVCL